MKKIIILLIIIFVGLLGYSYYKQNQVQMCGTGLVVSQSSSMKIGDIILNIFSNSSSVNCNINSYQIPGINFEDNIQEQEPNLNNQVSFSVYFNNIQNDPSLINCQTVYPVSRQIPFTQSVATAAMNQLIAGPTQSEQSQGFLTSIPSSSLVNSLTINQGTAFIDVSSSFYSAGGSCGIASVTSSIKDTLLQFPTVNNVEITVDGIIFSDYAQRLV